MFIFLCYFNNLGGSHLDETLHGSHFLTNLDTRRIRLFDTLGLLLENNFNMRRLRRVLSNTTMGTVGTTTSRRRSVALRMFNDAVLGIETLGFGVGRGIAHQISVDGRRLDGPTSFGSGDLELFGLGAATARTGVFDKGDDGFEGQHIVQIPQGLGNGHALGVVGNFTTMLEMDSEMGAARLGGLFRDFGFHTVSSHGEVMLEVQE
jgi:hypothetical protein